jgi:hypothetical protein
VFSGTVSFSLFTTKSFTSSSISGFTITSKLHVMPSFSTLRVTVHCVSSTLGALKRIFHHSEISAVHTQLLQLLSQGVTDQPSTNSSGIIATIFF